MQELIKVLNYEGNNVTFKNEDGVTYVNATEMAKGFGKRTGDYLSNQSTHEFIEAYIRNNPDTANPVTVVKGGLSQGTWMHEDIALDFAQWLSVDFRMWCNNRIKELINNGKTEINPIARLSNVDVAKMWLAAEEGRDAERKAKEAAQKQLKLDAPKVLFANALTESKDTVLVKELATFLNQNGIDIGQNRLFIWLREKGYLCAKGESYNLPTQRAMDLRLFEVKKTSIVKPNGTILTTNTTKVTGRGLEYFLNKFLTKSIDHANN